MSISHARPGRGHSIRTRRNRIQATLENLESRLLMSAVTTSAIGAVSPFGITHDNAGNIWVAGGDGVYKVGPDGQQIGSPAAPGASAFDVVFDPVNQHLFYSDNSLGQIVELGLDGSVINTNTVPDTFAQAPMTLAVANDGSIWFTTPGTATDTSFSSDIGRLDLSGNISFATVNNVTPGFIAAAPDGSVWFSASGFDPGTGLLAGASIGHAQAQSDGSITVDPLYSVSTPASIVQQITVANDGSVWFGLADRGTGTSADGPNRIVHGVLAGGTLVQTEYVIPGATDSSAPVAGSLALDNAGRLWFTDTNTDRISYMDTATGGFTQMALPSTIAEPLVLNIASDGVWATAASNGDNLIHVDLGTFTPPIVAADAPNIDATVGTPFTGTLATFQTADTGTFNYTIDYGNGTHAAGSLNSDSSGVYSIPANVTYAAAGTFQTSVTITTEAGNLLTVTGTAVASSSSTSTPVVGQGINIAGPEDAPLAANRTIAGQPKLAVATFSGPAATYAATINWGNGTSSAGQVVDLGGGMYAVVAATSKTYSTNGTFSGQVVITGGPNALTVGFTATISDTPLVVSTGLTLRPLLGRIVLTSTATFTDDVDSTASWFSATINWGDGTSSTGLVVRDPFTPGKYLVIGLHVYSHKGTYQVLTLISNNQEDVSATATATISVK